MSYLKKLGLEKSNYDRFPYVAVAGYEGHCWRGWDNLATALQAAVAERSNCRVVAVECHTGLYHEEVLPALEKALQPVRTVVTERDVFLDEAAVDALVAPDLGGEDPVFGRLTRLTMDEFLDSQKVAALRDEVANTNGLLLVYGPGASLCVDADLLVYADMPRWEGQLRQRAGRVDNLGVRNRGVGGRPQYKRAFFIDWRVCDKLKRGQFDRWDFLLDTTAESDPKLITGEALRAGLKAATRRPFRLMPFFDPGVWGGQWLREVIDLPDGPPNYAWGFDCVPEENSLLLGFGDVRVEIPSINLVFRHPESLLGEPVYGRYGAEFPIRFDFLDTMHGQNLSFQVHPGVDYAYDNFGLRYTQDESYYILDADEDAEVYLGLKEDVDPTAMLTDLRIAAEDPERPFADDKHVARHPARKHDHFLIPAGTCHCSGSGSMVLEISHTPYIFTFKLWDWSRMDLDGKPRPINLERGAANIRWERREQWVKDNLINQIEPVAEGDGWKEERTGLYCSEAYETRRHWFTGTVPHDTKGDSVHVLNLVEGSEALLESPVGAFEPFVVHYAETFIVPAAVGAYTIRPHGLSEGKRCATIKAFMRVNP